MSEICLTGACGAVRFQIIPSGCISCNAVVLWHEETRDAIVIDPTDDATRVIEFSTQMGLHVHQILLTHAHFDHAADAERAMTEFSCPASLHADDLPLYLEIPFYAPSYGLKISPRTLALTQVKDRQSIRLVPDCELEVLHLPGHSPGSVAYHAAKAGWVFAGDTLFNSGVGRTDLPGGSTRKLIESIRSRLYALAPDTIVICGHGPTTTIGREKRFNPYVRVDPVEPSP
jgi:hydroxyacylglutathione hydrolase